MENDQISQPPTQKGWKITAIILIIISVLLAGLSAFLIVEKINNKEDCKKKGDDIVGSLISKFHADKEYVFTADQYDIQNTYNTNLGGEGEDFKGTIKLPFINLDSPEVAAINDQLKAKYDDAVKNIVKTEFGDSQFTLIDYSFSISDDILSVLVGETPLSVPGGGFQTQYSAHNIDMKTGKALSNEALLSTKGVTMEQALAKAKSGVTDFIKENLVDGQPASSVDNYVKNAKITGGNAIYLNKDGKLVFVAQDVSDGVYETSVEIILN